MAKIGDRYHVKPFYFRKNRIGKTSITSARSFIYGVKRQAIAQKTDSKFVHKFEILFPVFVVAAFFHFIDASTPAMDRRCAILDARRKHEEWRHHGVRCHINWQFPALEERSV
jgi:hypothetical protein